jgi:hypothetical protein
MTKYTSQQSAAPVGPLRGPLVSAGVGISMNWRMNRGAETKEE